MKKLKSILLWIISAIRLLVSLTGKVFKSIVSWLKSAMTGKTEYWIGILALVAWFVIYLFSALFGIESYPIGYFQKIAFGILAMSIISAVTFIWAKATLPFLGKLLDPNSKNYQKLDLWQQLKVSLFFFAFYGLGVVMLASLY